VVPLIHFLRERRKEPKAAAAPTLETTKVV
jgi:hypothetical protein